MSAHDENSKLRVMSRMNNQLEEGNFTLGKECTGVICRENPIVDMAQERKGKI